MSELTELVSIYGQIDRAVRESPERRAAVSRLLPMYRDPDVHWFDDFEAWTKELIEQEGGEADHPFHELEEALVGLAEIRPRCRMRARRLYAIAAAAQAFPELQNLESEMALAAQRALRFEAPEDGHEEAENLLELLGDLSGIGDEGDDALEVWWQNMLESGLIAYPEGIGPLPKCTGRLVLVDLPGIGRRPVPTLETEFVTDLTFSAARKFLKPESWKECCAFWCEMEKFETVGNVQRYHEIVSLDCPHKERTWTVRADLDFRFRRPDNDVAMADYELRDRLPQHDVLVDEGSLVVRRLASDAGSRTWVKTTKRILFNGPVDGAALASIMCHVGYLSFVEDLLCCAAGDDPDTPYPGRQPAEKSKRIGGARSVIGPVTKVTTDEVAAAFKACIEDCSEAMKSSLDKIEDGRYAADDLVRDMASMWVRALREGATAVDIGVRSAQTGASSRTRRRSRS